MPTSPSMRRPAPAFVILPHAEEERVEYEKGGLSKATVLGWGFFAAVLLVITAIAVVAVKTDLLPCQFALIIAFAVALAAFWLVPKAIKRK